MNLKHTEPLQTLRIEIWMKENMEWSLEGDGSDEQFQLAGMKIRSLFSTEDELQLVKNKDEVSAVSKDEALSVIKNSLLNENLMLCDEKFTRMMVFFYLSKVE
ncbi:MAG: hypothetical protein DHS20C13_03520 [Thermodesulfobacteriota bacterium]|nr:MAG: hypothetical protein DHS20C13_03520 [Thermodesulfobacteriota bacterium]